VQRHAIGRQLHLSSSGSTPHDCLAIANPCVARAGSRTATAERAQISARCRKSSDIELDAIRRSFVSRLTVEQLVALARCQISQLSRGAQFLTAPTAPLYLPQARFPSSEAFGRRPPSAPQHLSSGRHPKPLYGAYPCQVASGGVESFYHVSRLHLWHGQRPGSAALSGQAPTPLAARRRRGA
jgi:hypothetical protein